MTKYSLQDKCTLVNRIIYGPITKVSKVIVVAGVVNDDGPALWKADDGLAMSAVGTGVTKNASGITLAGDNSASDFETTKIPP